MVQDVELLEKLWGLVTDWQQLYNGWKDGRFGDLKVEEMEEAAGRIAKSLQRLGREIKHWPAWTWIKVKSEGHVYWLIAVRTTDSVPTAIFCKYHSANPGTDACRAYHTSQNNVLASWEQFVQVTCIFWPLAFKICRKQWIRSRKRCR